MQWSKVKANPNARKERWLSCFYGCSDLPRLSVGLTLPMYKQCRVSTFTIVANELDQTATSTFKTAGSITTFE